MPASNCSCRPETRTWKYSSRLAAKIARNFARSRSGCRASSASASTRALKSSQESSRLRSRAGSRASPSSSVPAGAGSNTPGFGTPGFGTPSAPSATDPSYRCVANAVLGNELSTEPAQSRPGAARNSAGRGYIQSPRMATTDPRFLAPSPFSRLVSAHAVSMCGDACIAASLAGSLFFSTPASSSREKVLLYLLVTMLPFAVVAPVLGPALDYRRSGRRLLVVVSMLGRAVLALMMARWISDPAPAGLLVYPLAFGILVLAKGYSVAKSALVPALVEDPSELVKANSRLALVSVIATTVGGGPAFLVQEVFGPEWSLRFAAVVFVVGGILATKIPRVRIEQSAQEARLEREELHQPSILLAGSAMAVMRGAVGFLAFFAAFSLKSNLFALGVAATMAVVGGFVGNVIGPHVRRVLREEQMVAAALLVTASFVMVGTLLATTPAFAISSLAVAVGAATGRLAFDSLLQRDGPDAARGRAFARFETRFQVAWVIGALIGIIPQNV